VVDDGANGRLLAANASNRTMAEAIEDFFNHPATADQWGRQALTTARSLSRAVCARRLEKLDGSILENRSAGAEEQIADELIPWDSILQGIKVEWELISQKANAAVSALRTHELPDTE